jgi:hypothetical protein
MAKKLRKISSYGANEPERMANAVLDAKIKAFKDLLEEQIQSFNLPHETLVRILRERIIQIDKDLRDYRIEEYDRMTDDLGNLDLGCLENFLSPR